MVYAFISSCENLTEDDAKAKICALPFGNAEKNRLLSIKHDAYRCESLGALLCLERLLLHIGAVPCEIVRDELGKPHFAKNCGLSFSLSHTSGICAAALCDSGEIGLDIEVLRRGLSAPSIAKRFFSENEYKIFSQRGKTNEAFLELWTVKEACAKLYGLGLGRVLGKDIPNGSYIHTENITYGEQMLIMSIAAEHETEITLLGEPT